MTTRTLFLDTEHARDRMALAWRYACELLQFGKPVRVRIDEKESTRTLEQNAKLHALCGDIAKQRQWAGQWIDTEGWKRLLVDAWARTEGKTQGRVVPSLDGQSVVNLGIQTRGMRVKDMADLITFAEAWAVDNGIHLGDERRVAA
jgi:hypothetical protein